MLLRLTRSVALATALLLAPHAAVGAPIAAQPTDGAGDASMLLLLDASRSMEDPDAEGEPKIDAARAALNELIDGLDPAQSVGLRVFGGSVALDQPAKDKCTDSELVVPIGTDNADALSTAVEDYSPLGETPIAHALNEAAQDLGEVGNRTIVLVSDGIATCDPDPCEVAEQLTADGLDMVVHTVGLGADEQTRGQLQCIAEAGGGKYYDATDAASLTSVLTRVSSRAFRPFTIQGVPVSGSSDPVGAPQVAPGGQYADTFGVPGQAKYYTVRRTSPGTAITVGASAQPAFGTSAMAELRLETVDGEWCASSRFYAGTDLATASVMSGAVHVDTRGESRSNGTDTCGTAEELRLAIEVVEPYRGTEGVPFEMLITEFPALSDAPIPEVEQLPRWTPMEASAPQEIVPGSSFNDAAPVTPGTSYAVDVMPGEVLFFRVQASFGQAVQMRVDSDPAQMSRAQVDSLGNVGRLLVRNIYTPERDTILNLLRDEDGIGALDGDGNMIITPSGPQSGAASSGQIRFSNRGASRQAFTDGTYYLSLSYDPGSSGTPIPLTLTFDVVGDAVPGPETAEGPAPDDEVRTADASTDAGAIQTSEATPTEEPDTEQPDETAAQSTEEDSGMPWAWLLGGAGVLVAAAGAALLATRAGRRGTQV